MERRHRGRDILIDDRTNLTEDETVSILCSGLSFACVVDPVEMCVCCLKGKYSYLTSFFFIGLSHLLGGRKVCVV
jgi:hypothetical protein